MGKKHRKMKKLKTAQHQSAPYGVVGQVQETCWDLLGQEAVERVGRGPQLKGVVHEVALRERLNLDPVNLWEGRRYSLNPNASSPGADLLGHKGGVIVDRVQVKDVVSDAGIRDLQRRLGDGQYQDCRLVGSTEGSARFNAEASGGRQMTSSGISSRTTTRAADNAGAKVRHKDLLGNNVRDIGCASVQAAGVSAVIGAGLEGIHNLDALNRGELSGEEFVGRVVHRGVVSGVSSAGRTAAALGLKEGAKVVAKAAGSQSLKRLAGSNPGTAVAFGLVEQGLDVAQWIHGDIDDGEFGARTCKNVGSTGGAIGGATAGAALGSIIPGVGTVVGGLIGGLIGGLGGGAAGHSLGREFFK